MNHDDEELEARLRRLAAAPAPADDEKDERFWVEMAANVRADYEASRLVTRRRLMRRPIRRWMAPVAAGLAMAAALALWMRVQRPVVPMNEPIGDEITVFDEQDPGELLEELSPAQLERLERALKKEGA
jgi:hypothetical protein